MSECVTSVDFPIHPYGPGEQLPYGFDLSPCIAPGVNKSAWLAPGDMITGLVVAADEGLMIVSQGIADNDQGVPASVVFVRPTGGTIGTDYNVQFTFTAASGNVGVRTLIMRCVDR